MAGIYVNDEGTWKLPKSIWINQLGTWRVCSNVYVRSGGAWREMIKSVELDSSKQNFNLYEYVGSPAQPLSLIFNIGANKEITTVNTVPSTRPMTATTVPTAFTVGNFPSGSTVIINNNGYISGGGGYGGGGTGYNNSKVPPGQNGGNGIEKGSSNNFDCTIVNTGTIAAGGGGGGGGQYITYYGKGAEGGEGAGIPGNTRTQGGAGQYIPVRPPQSIVDPGSPSSEGGQGGDNGGDGESKTSAGGKGGKAIVSNGIEIAVSGTILGEVV